MRLKKFIIALSVLFLVFSANVWAQSKSPLEDSLKSFDALIANLKISSVVGEPIRSGNTTVIPFARISFGLGAGGAMMGYGGGMGGKAIPAGLLIIEGEEARVELFPIEEKKPSLLQELLPVLLQALPKMMGEKSPFAVKPPQAKVETPAKPGKPVEGKSLDDAKKLFEEKKYSEALEVVDSLLAADPNNAELHAWKGNIMGSLAQGNPADMIKYGMGAMQEYEKAVELDPKNVSAHFGRGMGRLMAPEGFGGDVNGAIEDLEFASAKGSFPEAYYYLGIAYQRKGLKDKAKDAFKKALSLKPNYPEAAKALAEIK